MVDSQLTFGFGVCPVHCCDVQNDDDIARNVVLPSDVLEGDWVEVIESSVVCQSYAMLDALLECGKTYPVMAACTKRF